MSISYIIVTLAIISVGIPNTVFATSNNEDEDLGHMDKAERPAINLEFNPDESCLFDAYQLKCIPGSEREYPEGFGNNEDSTCWAQTLVNGEWVRFYPEGYHSTDNDETGQCYPNSEPCLRGSALVSHGEYDRWSIM